MDALDLADATLTFLFSDIEGSTRLEQEVGTRAYADVRERHRVLLRAAFAACGGEEQGTEGDSFFVVFHTARGALTAAVAAQRAVAAEPWPPDAEIRVRMGIHSGEARVAGGSLVGIDINRAARIAGVAYGGQVLVSDTTRALVHGEPLGDVAFRDLGPHRLKDLHEPQHLYQLVADGLRTEFPGLRSLDGRRVRLPAQLTSFVGRDRRGRRRRAAAGGAPAGDADRSRRDGEDPPGAAARRRRRGRLRRRRLLREPRRRARPGPGRLADRHEPGPHRDRQPPDPRPAGGVAGREGDPPGARQLRAGHRRRAAGRRSPPRGTGPQAAGHVEGRAADLRGARVPGARPAHAARPGRADRPRAGPASRAGAEPRGRRPRGLRVRGAVRRPGDGRPPGVPGHERERGGRRGDLCPIGRDATGHRARRRAGEAAHARGDPQQAHPPAGDPRRGLT